MTIAFSFLATWAVLWVVDRLVGLRVDEEDEETGLDVSQHGETAHALVDRPARRLTPDEELARLREQLVLGATRRVLEAVKEPNPLD